MFESFGGWISRVDAMGGGGQSLIVTLTFDSSPIKETFAKLSRTVIMCPDSQSLKLHFDIYSRLRGNDGRFCKGLHQGRGGCNVVFVVAASLTVIPA